MSGLSIPALMPFTWLARQDPARRSVSAHRSTGAPPGYRSRSMVARLSTGRSDEKRFDPVPYLRCIADLPRHIVSQAVFIAYHAADRWAGREIQRASLRDTAKTLVGASNWKWPFEISTHIVVGAACSGCDCRCWSDAFCAGCACAKLAAVEHTGRATPSAATPGGSAATESRAIPAALSG